MKREDDCTSTQQLKLRISLQRGENMSSPCKFVEYLESISQITFLLENRSMNMKTRDNVVKRGQN